MEENTISTFGDLLKKFRKQQKITQQELAARLGIHRNTIGTWEHGDFLPDSKTMVLELARQLRLDEQDTRRLLEASLTALSPYWHLPHQRNPFFTGRSTILDVLHQKLQTGLAPGPNHFYALQGLGGIGKTQLALEYAYRHAMDYYAVFWVSAETSDVLINGFVSLAEHLQLSEYAEKEYQTIVKAVLRWLATHKDWMLIFDNVEDLAVLKQFLPAVRQGTVLMTTRLHALDGFAQGLEVPPFTTEEGIHFLLRRSRLIDPFFASETPSEAIQPAYAVVERMGGLPLALDQVGAYIEQTGCSLTDYWHIYQKRQVLLLAERSIEVDHPHSVVQTFLLSLEKASLTNAATVDLFYICAFLAPDTIPEELFIQGAHALGPVLSSIVSDPYLFNKLLGDALRYSLLSRKPEQQTFSLHRLLQVVLRETLSEQAQTTWMSHVIEVLHSVFPEPGLGRFDPATWKLCERLVPHVLQCARHIASWKLEHEALASLFFKTGSYLTERAQYQEAKALLLRAIQIREHALGLEHPDVAPLLNSLGRILYAQGNYVEAQQQYQRALQIWEWTPEAEHSHVAETLTGLASQYLKQDKYADAEPLYERALRMRERTLEANHPLIATSLSNLAILLSAQGNYAQAEPLFERALQMGENALGANHPAMTRILTNLGKLYQEQGKYTEAQAALIRALQIREQTLGVNHPDLAYTLANLGVVYQEQGNYAEAEVVFTRALQLRKQLLNPDHPEIAYLLNCLAHLFREQGRDKEAEQGFQNALRIWELVDSANPDRANSLSGLAMLCVKQGNDERAKSLYQQALNIREHTLGADHPKTREIRTTYAHFLKEVRGKI